MARIAACYGQLGRITEAKAVAAAVIRLELGFRITTQFRAGGRERDNERFRRGMRLAGLPE